MSGCSCGCTPHDPSCPAYEQIVAPDAGLSVADGCGADEANSAVWSTKCSVGVDLQDVLDDVRHLKTELGFTPYRVWLVWEEQGDDGVYRDVRRVELQPVEVRKLDEVALTIGAGGMQPEGQIQLVRMSPRQVRQDALLGRLDGRTWSGDRQRFFYEVVARDECAGPSPTRFRFAPAAIPVLSRSKSPIGWSIKLTSQMPARGRHGEDRTVALGEPAPAASKWGGART
jgi:hypothetical protein